MPFAHRIWMYFRSMQPLHLTIFFSFLHFFSMFLLFGALAHSLLFPPFSVWYAMMTTVLFYITFRLNDEIKDEEFDRLFHPQRPMVAGIVKYADLKILSITLFAVMIALNFNRGFVTSAFMILIVFLAMWAQSFYFPDEIGRSYWLTLITGGHAMLLLTNYYFYVVYCSVSTSKPDSPWLVAGICLLFILPSAAWEISRKTRAPIDETDFPSYSLRWGVRLATLIPMTYIAITATSLVALGLILKFSIYYVLANALLGIGVLATFYAFLLRPTSARNHLRQANEIYDVGARFIIVAEAIKRML